MLNLKSFRKPREIFLNLTKNKYFMPILKRFLVYSFIAVLLFWANEEIKVKVASYTKNILGVPSGGIVFVNQLASADFKNGSIEHPFSEIKEALEFIKKNSSFKIIHVSTGVYSEKVSLPENVILTGETASDGKLLTSIQSPEKGSDDVIVANNNVTLFRLLIKDGRYNVHIPENKDNVLISNCTITNASKYGIFNEKNSSNLPRLRIINTSVVENGKQGAYLKKSSVEIRNSFFNRNGEEGIDLHAGMTTVIDNVEVMENKEGGVETEIGDINLIIKNSKFIGNGSSGINLQTFEENSFIEIRNNIITNNLHFGIRCALHAPIKSPYFTKMVKISDDNVFDQNGKEDIDPTCKAR